MTNILALALAAGLSVPASAAHAVSEPPYGDAATATTLMDSRGASFAGLAQSPATATREPSNTGAASASAAAAREPAPDDAPPGATAPGGDLLLLMAALGVVGLVASRRGDER